MLPAQQIFPTSPQALHVPREQIVDAATHVLTPQHGSSTPPHAVQIALAPAPSQFALPLQERFAQQMSPMVPHVAVAVDVRVDVGEAVAVAEDEAVAVGVFVAVDDSVAVLELVPEPVSVVDEAVVNPVPVVVGTLVAVGEVVVTPVPVAVGGAVATPLPVDVVTAVPVDVGGKVATPVSVLVGGLESVPVPIEVEICDAGTVADAVAVAVLLLVPEALAVTVLLPVIREVRLPVPASPPPSLLLSKRRPFEFVVQAATTTRTRPITHWIGDRYFEIMGDPPNG